MAAYDLNLVYCTEADVFATGRQRWSATTRPTDDEVYGFARRAKGYVHNATRRAGSDLPPPASAIADDSNRQMLIRANAVGAAMFAWEGAASVGDANAIAMYERLREEWVQAVGGMNAAGHQVVGAIVEGLQAVNGILVMHSDVIDGFSTFPNDVPTETLGRRFTTADRD